MPKEIIRLTKLEAGTYIKGTIKADADLRIDGKVEGALKTSQKLFIGDSGIFKGEATADHMDICGHFQGSVHVKHKLFVSKTAHLEADVYVGSIEVEEGAHFQGKCFMMNAETADKDQIKTKQLHPNKPNKMKKEEDVTLSKAAL